MILKKSIHQILVILFLGLVFYHPAFAKDLSEYQRQEHALITKLARTDPQDLTRATRKEVRQLFQEVATFLSEIANSDLNPNEKAKLIIELAEKASKSLKAISRGFDSFPEPDRNLSPLADAPKRAVLAWAQGQANLWTLRFFRGYRARRALLKQIMHDLEESIKKSNHSPLTAASQALVISDARSTELVTDRQAALLQQPNAWMMGVYALGLGFLLMYDPLDFVGHLSGGPTHFSGAVSGIFYNTWQLLSVWAFLSSTGGHFAHDVLHLESELKTALGENGCQRLFEDPETTLKNLMRTKK